VFDKLSERLQSIFGRARSHGRLSESQVDELLVEIRRALLEADVNFKVVRNLIGRIKERAIGSEVHQALNPGQQVIKIVHEELIATLGKEAARLHYASRPPTVIMMAGLQGSGKTTQAAKLALHFKKQGHHPLLVAADLQRPAAVQQLQTLGRQAEVPVFALEGATPVQVAAGSIKEAERLARDVVIVDTAGRLQTQRNLLEELAKVGRVTSKALDDAPYESLLVLDAVLGLTNLVQAREFNKAIPITGLALAKLDSTAKGGAAISIESELDVPVKLAGVGEGIEDLEPFDPSAFIRAIFD